MIDCQLVTLPTFVEVSRPKLYLPPTVKSLRSCCLFLIKCLMNSVPFGC